MTTSLTTTQRDGIAALATALGADGPATQAADRLDELPQEQRTGLLQLLEVLELMGLRHQPVHLTRVLVRVVANISAETRAGIDGWRQLTGAAQRA